MCVFLELRGASCLSLLESEMNKAVGAQGAFVVTNVIVTDVPNGSRSHQSSAWMSMVTTPLDAASQFHARGVYSARHPAGTQQMYVRIQYAGRK